MDHQRFDQLSRRFAAQRTRRQALKALAGAAVGVIAGSRAATAQTCVPQYSPCTGDADCCAGAVCEYGMCMPGCRVDGTFLTAWASPPENICGQCLPDVSTTSLVPANEGMSCWSGDPNAGVTTCQNGACAPLTASCPPPTPCHLEGESDPATGQCVYPPAPEGTPCGNGPVCAGGFYQPADACDGNGFCIGGGSQTVSCFPYECTADGCLTSCTSDDDCLAEYVCHNGACAQFVTTVYPLFCDSGAVCPTGATTFDAGGPLDPTSSDQAKAACEACFGLGQCFLADYPSGDCAGDAWVSDYTASFGFEESYCDDFGFPDYPNMPAGRVFHFGRSYPRNDFGLWGQETCPATISVASMPGDNLQSTSAQP